MIKKILLLGGFLVLIGAGYGYYLWNKKTPTTATRDVEMTLTANELAIQFENAKHVGKILAVKGKISIAETENGTTNVTLETQDPMMAISCEMEKNTDVPALKEGDEITVKGHCDGKLLTDIILTRCIVVQ